MKFLATIIALVAVMVYAGPASATTDPAATVTVRCVGGNAVATFVYSGFSPRNTLTASEQVSVAGGMARRATWTFGGPGSTHTLSVPLPAGAGPFVVSASTVVRAGGGRVKATARATVNCGTPPPPVRVDPRAHFWGPCGDPFYRAVLDNRRSDRAAKFVVSWQPFGDPRRELVRWVQPHRLVWTGLFDVAGSTRMTIRWQRPGPDRVLRSQVSAPNRVYAACPTGVAVIG